MPKQILAIATCRVSSIEQMESNSLNRQAKSVHEAAKYLSVLIPSDGVWSGSVSSKSGRNYKRKDLDEMIQYCKKHPSVKFLIVDEIDRFMRSIDEMFYFEVRFREEVGVKVWYAGDPALNSDDPMTKLRRAMEAFKAEGSNLERQIKSIKGQSDALLEGRYPFGIKPGYKRGYEKSVQEIDPVGGPELKRALLAILEMRLTASQALIEFNQGEFMATRSKYRMDKFRKIVTDSFYAGVVEINKQVKVRNINGLHEPLITMEQHLQLVDIMTNKKKTQSGPRKNGNPKYPMSNEVTCDVCAEETNGRLVGYDLRNGKKNSAIYERYRCRSCGTRQYRDNIHEQVQERFKEKPIVEQGVSNLLQALDTVWKQEEGRAEQETIRIKHKLTSLADAISNQVESATDPGNSSIKDEILMSITKKKAETADLEEQLDKLSVKMSSDKDQFIKFAFDYVENMSSKYFDISRENRLRCKQVIFPAGFYINVDNKVYTPKVSLLYRLATVEMNGDETGKTLLVEPRGVKPLASAMRMRRSIS